MISSISGATPLHTTANTVPAAHAPTEAAPSNVAKNDPVNISKLAQALASDGDTQAQEISESGAEKASEKARGKA